MKSRVSAPAKAILVGEHAVVYGRSALAAPIPLAVEARVVDAKHGVQLLIPRWGIEQRVPPVDEHPAGAAGILAQLLERLDLADRAMTIEVFPNVPRAMGLGGSAALAVSVIRALDLHFGLDLAAEEVNAFAFACEQTAHGTPSGVDNALATYGVTMLYRNSATGGERPAAQRTELALARPLPVVIGLSGKESLTAASVAHDDPGATARNEPGRQSLEPRERTTACAEEMRVMERAFLAYVEQRKLVVVEDHAPQVAGGYHLHAFPPARSG